MTGKKQKRLGFALSGSGTRSAFYIGFLEVMAEQNIPIHSISASSGATIAAAAYGCGTLEELKQYAFHRFTQKEFRRLISGTAGPGGLYSLDAFEQTIHDELTHGAKFEDLKCRMSFAAADLTSGESVHVCLGDIAHASRISCTVPGLFTPVAWGNKLLVDGGLLTIIPVEGVKQAGAEVVVGIDMRATRHIFADSLKTFRRAVNALKAVFFVDELAALANAVLPRGDVENQLLQTPGIFSILGKGLDAAVTASRQGNHYEGIDLLISPPERRVNRASDLDNPNPLYELGRNTALEHLPKILALL